MESQKIQKFQVEALKVEVHPTRVAAGAAAACAATDALINPHRGDGNIGIIFATGASQLDMLRALVANPKVPWHRIRGFHMDEYIGLDAEHPGSFRRYMRENLTRRVQMKEFFEIDGTVHDPEQACREYAETLRAADPQLCLLGIGENGHLAFNDPAEANFHDPLDMKIVRLDTVCRQQQAAEGWFRSLEEIPERAMTLTIPTLFRVPKLILSVPSARKAHIMRRTLLEPISTDCPSTILRTHPDATVYLDRESAAELVGIFIQD